MNRENLKCSWYLEERTPLYPGKLHRTHMVPCTLEALILIVYGCMEGHLTENPFCGVHTREWNLRQAKGNITCHCGKTITDYEMCTTVLLTENYRWIPRFERNPGLPF